VFVSSYPFHGGASFFLQWVQAIRSELVRESHEGTTEKNFSDHAEIFRTRSDSEGGEKNYEF